MRFDAELWNRLISQENCNVDEGEETRKGDYIRDSIAAVDLLCSFNMF